MDIAFGSYTLLLHEGGHSEEQSEWKSSLMVDQISLAMRYNIFATSGND